MYDLAIICSTVEERKLLFKQSLNTWIADASQTNLNITLRVYEDGFTGTWDDMPANLHPHIISTKERSGSHITGYNYIVSNCKAKVYLFTHPEILFPFGTIEKAYNEAIKGNYNTFKVFWLPKDMEIYTNDGQDIACLENDPNLFLKDPREHGKFYWNSDIRGITNWESTTTYAMNREMVDLFFPFPSFKEWGPDDPWMMSRRKILGVKTNTIMNPVLFHQWHPHAEIDAKRVCELANGAL